MGVLGVEKNYNFFLTWIFFFLFHFIIQYKALMPGAGFPAVHCVNDKIIHILV